MKCGRSLRPFDSGSTTMILLWVPLALLLCTSHIVLGKELEVISSSNRTFSLRGQGIGLHAEEKYGAGDRVQTVPTPITNLSNSSSIVINPSQRNLLVDRRWKVRKDGRVLVPHTVSSTFSSAERNQIRDTLNDMERTTGSLKFIERTNERAYIAVRRETAYCSSHVGTSGSTTLLNLGPNCMSKAVIQHEFLHALGFHHEQNRPDRDQYVEIIFDNIIETNQHNFNRQSGSTTLGSPYDYGSVMHYGAYDFSKNKLKTIVTKNGESIGQRNGMSPTDVKKVKLMYQCERNVRQWSSLEANPCTSDCTCKEGESGCGSNSNACFGDLVCSGNKCVDRTAPTPAPAPTPTPEPPTSSSTAFILHNQNPDDFRYYCIDLYARSTTNSNKVWYYKCNFSPAQYWYKDSAGYIRSKIDINKCLVGWGGRTTKGTGLMIYDCFSDDPRFMWDIYQDGSIRPRNNDDVCITPSTAKGGQQDLVLYDCDKKYSKFVSYSRADTFPSDLAYNIWQNTDHGTYAFDLESTSIKNGLRVQYSLFSSGSQSQRWIWDSHNQYIRTSLDNSMCLVSVGGLMDRGTSMQVWKCYVNDVFRWVLHSDGSIRPHQNEDLCLETRFDSPGTQDLILDECHDGWKQFNWNPVSQSGDRRNLKPAEEKNASSEMTPLENATISSSSAAEPGIKIVDVRHDVESTEAIPINYVMEASPGGSSKSASSAMVVLKAEGNCEDNPLNWYDIFGRNCAWYSQEDGRCEDYGFDYANFGKTAFQACCVCGGAQDDGGMLSDDPMQNESGCYDLPNWYDSTEDGCNWYANEDSYCDDYGTNFSDGNGIVAADACCICGGGTTEPPQEADDSSTPGCSDLPFDWYTYSTPVGDNDEVDIINCPFLAENDGYCEVYGNYQNFDGITANEACCFCGGGLGESLSPDLVPTAAPTHTPTPRPSFDEASTSAPSFDSADCKDDEQFKFKNKNKKSCKKWIARLAKTESKLAKNFKKIEKLCKKKWEGKHIFEYCQETCAKVGLGPCA